MNFQVFKKILSLTAIRYYLFLLLLLVTCKASYALPVIVYNDLDKESEGRLIEIDEVETTETKRIRYRLRIYPNQEKEIARGSVLRFLLSRIFPAHKLKYEIRCPDEGEITRITIQEIHENRMGGNCELARYGHWSRRTGSQWTNVKSKETITKSPTNKDTKDSPKSGLIPW